MVTGSVTQMLAFLSPAWLAALDRAARSDRSLATATAELDLVVEQRVTGTPSGEVVFHVVLDHGTASVAAGAAPAPTVTFTQDLTTARAIASGAESAQRAFMTGSLRVGGDLRALIDNQAALAVLEDVFAEVRSRTDLGPSAAEVTGPDPQQRGPAGAGTRPGPGDDPGPESAVPGQAAER